MESELYWNQLKNGTIATAQPNCNGQTLSKMKLPIPPLEEQNRIILKLQKLEPLIQKYQKVEEQLYELNSSIKEHLKKSILQYAIEGKLVPQDPNDEPASILLERIQKEKQKLISEGKIKKNKNESVIYRRDNSYYEKHDTNTISIDDRIPFSIPNSWEWISLGMVLEIERGGSPRPIKAYLTNDDNAINWIKIGDTEKDKKYINQVKEKIIPEGAAKSRIVYKGDFLLTNSMSFGRPYILNVDGCIHDGWLVLRDKYHAFNKDFLYYLLSSTFAYYQFCNSVSGAVVKNLNSEKVSASIFPIPPLNEQHKIATKLDKLYSYIE